MKRKRYPAELMRPLPDLRAHVERLPAERRELARAVWRTFHAFNVKRRVEALFTHYGIEAPGDGGIWATRKDGPVSDPWPITDEAAPWYRLTISLATSHVAGLRFAKRPRGRPATKWPEHKLALLWLDGARAMLAAGKQEGIFAVLASKHEWRAYGEKRLETEWRRAHRTILGGAIAIAPTTIRAADGSQDRNSADMLKATMALVEVFFEAPPAAPKSRAS
jgi:hypothetical protein